MFSRTIRFPLDKNADIMKEPSLAPTYCYLYPVLAEVARKNGYALAIHGSMQSDFDLFAIPWTDAAVSAEQLVEAITGICNGWIVEKEKGPTVKPHGRLVWTIILGGQAYIDFGVMPRK